jgi:hypothetical protein
MTKSSRKIITPNFDARLLTEVNNLCPLCGKRLLGEKAKRSIKFYKIAHIYPHSPTSEQLKALGSVPRSTDIESFENLIALCEDCHDKQDFYTTVKDYMILYNIKQILMDQTIAMDSATKVLIEEQIEEVLSALKNIDVKQIVPLSYDPVAVEQKITRRNGPLLLKIKHFVVQYYPFVQEKFVQIDKQGQQKFNEIAIEFKLCFMKFEERKLSQEDIFIGLVNWLQSKTQNQYGVACEIIVAFFVQNCEVFNAISE